MILYFILGGITLLAVVMGIMHRKATGSFNLNNFLQSFGVDLSEGFEALWIGMRVLILLGLQLLFAHLEASTIQQLMPYRHDSYLMGLGFAAVAMICGMTASMEIKLQYDRIREIKPAIDGLDIASNVKDLMLNIYNRKYRTARFVIGFNLIIAVLMHATIVLISMFSLWQHQQYSQLVMNGLKEVPGLPVLHYAGYFGSPLLISSIFVGGLGLLVELLLGLVSNVKEELYKYKPNMEIINTTRELEEEYGEVDGDDDYDDDEDDDIDNDDHEENDRFKKEQERLKREAEDKKRKDQEQRDREKLDLDESDKDKDFKTYHKHFEDMAVLVKEFDTNMDFKYIGEEATLELMRDLLTIISKSKKVPGFNPDINAFEGKYNEMPDDKKKMADNAIKTQYKISLGVHRNLETAYNTCDRELAEYYNYTNNKKDDDLQENELVKLKKRIDPSIIAFKECMGKLDKQFKSVSSFFNTSVFA